MRTTVYTCDHCRREVPSDADLFMLDASFGNKERRILDFCGDCRAAFDRWLGGQDKEGQHGRQR